MLGLEMKKEHKSDSSQISKAIQKQVKGKKPGIMLLVSLKPTNNIA